MNKISAYIIAYNEAEKIRDAVHTVLWADEVVVADSFSEDDTARIAAALGARVVQIPFSGFGELRNKALESCTHEWIFSLDADERCSAAVRDEILEIIKADDAADVYFVPRRNYFMGQWIKHSGFYPNYRQPQLFRKKAMTYKPDQVHEGYDLHTEKEPGYLKNAIWQMPFKDLAEIQHKANKYSTLGAEKLAQQGRTATMAAALVHGLWSFIQHYFLKRGLFDGWAGFIIALGNFEGTFYRYAKLNEMKQDWKFPASGPLTRKKDP